LIQDYLNQSDQLKPFITDFPSLATIESAAKKRSMNVETRLIVHDAIVEQYTAAGIELPARLQEFKSVNAFTITTGHQLNLLGGPKYFIYKIVSVLKLAETMNKQQSALNFLPVFWMATEDHDFEEINRVKLFDEVVQAKEEKTGPVGRIDATHFEAAYQEVKRVLGTSVEAGELNKLFEEAFKQKSLAAFTRAWVNELFDGKVIIVDGDDVALKTLFIPVAEREMKEQLADKYVSATNKQLEEDGYHIQVGQRPVNLFYIEDGVRERVGFLNGQHKVHNLSKCLTFEEVNRHPERISPNALLRPVYQETILPNVAYVGGPGELAYWFQLKQVFDELKVSFPILVLRDSFLFVRKKDKDLLKKLGMCLEDLMLSEDELKKLYISKNGLKELDFMEELNALNGILDKTDEKVARMHRDYHPMLEAERSRMVKFIEKMELRAMRDAKFREEVNLKKLIQLRNRYFPGGGLVERTSSFMEEYLMLGKESYFQMLLETSDVMDSRIKVLTVNK
jgi:bacillithiol biosynthesis cysteine-adding enzyme BshC